MEEEGKLSNKELRNPITLDIPLSPESAKLLGEKATIYADELLLLREARSELKRYLKPTEQELADCHVRVIYLSPDEAITDSSDDELLYSRAGIEQQKEAVAGLGKIALDIATQKASKVLPKNATVLKLTDQLNKGKRKIWKLTYEGASAIKFHSRFGKIYKNPSDGLWLSIDRATHGGTTFKVFKETKKGLEWIKDADEFGDFIVGKHKGSVGMFIPWGELRTIK